MAIDRTVHRRGAGDGEREAGVVGLGVVVHVRTGETVTGERRHVRQRGVDRDAVVALADAQAAGEVVHPERGAEHPGEPAVDHPAPGQDRDEEREHPHEVGRVLERPLAFVQRLVDEPELALLQVPQAAVHELRALRAGAGGEVVPLHQRGAQSAAGGVERHARAGDATADDEDVEPLLAETRAATRRARSHRWTGWSPGQVTGW